MSAFESALSLFFHYYWASSFALKRPSHRMSAASLAIYLLRGVGGNPPRVIAAGARADMSAGMSKTLRMGGRMSGSDFKSFLRSLRVFGNAPM